MLSSWDEWNMGAVVCIITKCDLPAALAVFTLQRPAAAVILP